MKRQFELTPPSASDALGASQERELSAIVSNVWLNAEKLLRQEVQLGLAELSQRADKLKQGLLTATITGAFLLAGVLTLLAAVVLGLSKVMEPWLSALIVGGLVTGVGVTLLMREQKHEPAVGRDEPGHRTTRIMKEAIK